MLTSSSIIYTIVERLGYAKLQPRSSSPLGLFAKYDGNIIGGGLLGVGMALSGACPGTLLTQVSVGIRTGVHALNGAVLGGILWTGFLAGKIKDRNETIGVKAETGTIDELLSVTKGTMLFIFEAVIVSIVAATTIYTPPAPEVILSGAAAGLLIGLAQLFSLVTRGSMMGISGTYEEIGKSFWWFVKGADSTTQPHSYQNVMFGCGVVAGAWLLAQWMPTLALGTFTEVSPLLATVGGAVMIVGSRMAGGCTSGHGISGISLFSTSSVVTIASTFVVGALVVPLVH